MKRSIALILVLVICLSFVGCKKEKEMKTDIIGEWMAVSVNASVIFYEDGTGQLEYGGKQSLTWKYDPDLDRYVIAANQTYHAIFGKEYDMKYVNLMGIDFYSFDDYDKAYTLLISERCQNIVELTTNTPKIAVDTPYGFANGVTILFSNISVVEHFGNKALQLEYQITNNRAEDASALSVPMNGQFYLHNHNNAVKSAGKIEYPGTIAAGATVTDSVIFDMGEDSQKTIDVYGMVIGAVVLELYGENCYIDLSDWFKKSN